MGNRRILRYGAEFSLRTKRIIFFTIFFISLTSITLYSVNEITREDRDLLLSQKSVVLEVANFDSVLAEDAQLIADQFDSGSAYVTRYFSISSLNIKIFSLNINQLWGNPIVQPDEIRVGNYVNSAEDLGDNTYQALSSRDSVQLDSFSNSNLTSVSSVGTVHSFTSGINELSLEITGTFDKGLNLPKGELWFLTPDSTFDDLITFLNIQDSDIYAYQITIIASGYSEGFASIFTGSSIPSIESNIVKADSLRGTEFVFESEPSTDDIKTQGQSTDIILLIGLIGSPIVATLYAFIISRFRTREIAVLKAVGYSNNNVQTMLLSEIVTVSMLGFLISTFGFQILLGINAQTNLNTTYVPLIWNPFVDLFPSSIAIITFIFVVLSNIFGFIIVSRRSIAVRPVELFKHAG